jgi:hypothetical protein
MYGENSMFNQVVKYNYLAQLSLIVVIVLAAVLLLNQNTSSAQDQFSGQRWEYTEVVFQEPVTFGTSVGNGYFVNGNFRSAEGTDRAVRNVIGALGTQGWELVSVTNNQSFIFKRPLP